jgi:transcription elongation GreA/GreB family factor
VGDVNNKQEASNLISTADKYNEKKQKNQRVVTGTGEQKDKVHPGSRVRRLTD